MTGYSLTPAKKAYFLSIFLKITIAKFPKKCDTYLIHKIQKKVSRCMKKTRKTGDILFAAAAVLWVAVIFSFSLRSGAASHGESGFVERLLSGAARRVNLPVDRRILYWFFAPFAGENGAVSGEAVVRKAAHFTEYFVLGLFCAKAARVLIRRRLRFLVPFPLLCGPVVSLFDERFIQLFLVAGRTASYMDVLLDCIGFYCAVLLFLSAARLFALINGGGRIKTPDKKPG
jgi:Predicted integral membrane protein